MLDGRIVQSGDRSLADRLDTEGYDGLRASLGMGHPEGDSFLTGL